jgi:hypothetical protein
MPMQKRTVASRHRSHMESCLNVQKQPQSTGNDLLQLSPWQRGHNPRVERRSCQTCDGTLSACTNLSLRAACAPGSPPKQGTYLQQPVFLRLLSPSRNVPFAPCSRHSCAFPGRSHRRSIPRKSGCQTDDETPALDRHLRLQRAPLRRGREGRWWLGSQHHAQGRRGARRHGSAPRQGDHLPRCRLRDAREPCGAGGNAQQRQTEEPPTIGGSFAF